MNELIVKEVNFNGAQLMAAQDKETEKVYVGVKWVCDGIGLTNDQMRNERKKIQSDLVLSKGGSNLTLPTNGGNQEVLCIGLEFLPLWLAKISITPKMQEMQPELTEKLVEYQLKAKDVLAQAFLPAEYNGLSPQLQLLINMELKQKELEIKVNETDKKLDSIKDIVALRPNGWREDSKNLLVRMAAQLGGNEHIRDLREESYKLLDTRMGVSLKIRLANMRKSQAENGVCKSKRDKLNALDVIGCDRKLIEGYISIIKEMSIKYGAVIAQ